MNDGYTMIVTACPDKDNAKEIAKALIGERFAACVQMYPIESVYTWQGKVCEDNEVALFVKTKAPLFDKIAAVIKDNHPYEVPEIIQIPITDGLPEYLRWIDECVEG